MENNRFQDLAVSENHPLWEQLIMRSGKLYKRNDEIRSDFARDYTRILHSKAYRRLKHKTQVFFNIDNDHICTRMEHVSHVESVSSTIAKYLGLNKELTRAISVSHDMGHAPFGHQGESILQELAKEYLQQDFWHEKNSLRFADSIELLEDNYKKQQNLNLTYAVRDGIISHCGEVADNGIFPRKELIPLSQFECPNQYQPATWEGCVVKISDKIAYIGRDIEDAIHLGFLDPSAKSKLLKMAQINDENVMNTTVIMHNMIIDICKNSSPTHGITLSREYSQQLQELMQFNYDYIYKHERLQPFKSYSELVIKQIFSLLFNCYDGKHSWSVFQEQNNYYPILVTYFQRWLARYCSPDIVPAGELQDLALQCENQKIYNDLSNREIYIQAILDYISSMTDRFAIKVFNELVTY